MKRKKKIHRFNKPKPVFVIFVYSGIKENVALLVHCFVSIMPTQKYFLMATHSGFYMRNSFERILKTKNKYRKKNKNKKSDEIKN